jgi:cytochrome c biogenesis protein CcmG, thiol:disulfide interchange protein DsbE
VVPELGERPHTGGEDSPEASPPGQGRRGPLRFVAPVLGLVTAVGLIALLVYGVTARAPDTHIDDSLAGGRGVPAPSYRLAVLRRGSLGPRLGRRLAPALADRRISPSELRGTPYVLNVWASWCLPCRDEAPELTRAWRQQRRRGVLFVGLNMQDSPEDARAFMNHFGIDYLNIRDPTNDIPHRYGATGVPETYFVSAGAEIVGHVIGVVSPAQLRAGIAAAVAGRPQAARQGGDQRPAR